MVSERKVTILAFTSIIILKENNYKVWFTVLEQNLREKKLWGHVMGTAVRFLPPRVRAPVV